MKALAVGEAAGATLSPGEVVAAVACIAAGAPELLQGLRQLVARKGVAAIGLSLGTH